MVEAGLTLRGYRALSPLLHGILPVAAPWSAKLRAGLAGRRQLAARLQAAAAQVRGGVWVHAASVGEYEQARPVIAALKARAGTRPLPVAVTHFSPSGYEYAARRPAGDYHDYLPFDEPAAMRRLVAAWRPRLLIFFKFDCWPNQILAAREAEVPVVLLAGTLQPGSARLWPGVRAFFRDLFDRFAQLGVCTAEDRERFVSGLGVRCPVTVTGDTRAEQVILRYEAAADGAVASRLRAWGSTLLVLGSTWPRDERLWLPVLPELLAEFADLRVVLVPHEPLPARLSHLARDLGSRGIASMRLSQFMAGEEQDPETRCVLVDSVGVLAEIYRAGTLAYVGGSFTSGVHNTMEPAICGLPVLFGPVIQNAVEAGILQQKGGGFVLHRPAEAAARIRALLGDRTSLARSGEAARQVVLAQRGATEKSLAVLEPYL